MIQFIKLCDVVPVVNYITYNVGEGLMYHHLKKKLLSTFKWFCLLCCTSWFKLSFLDETQVRAIKMEVTEQYFQEVLFAILDTFFFTSRGRRPTCVISVPISAKQTKTRKHKQHNGSSRQIKQASLLSKSYHTIRRAESFKYFTTKADEIRSDWKGQNRIHVFFFQWHRVLLPFTPFPLHLAKVILAFLKRKEKLFQSS